jgi:hypothetical protein
MSTASSSYKGIRPRNDKVLIREDHPDLIGKLAVSQFAIEGKEFVIVAIGPKVEDLEVGDVVMMAGKENVDWAKVPNHKNLLINCEANVVLVTGHRKNWEKE